MRRTTEEQRQVFTEVWDSGRYNLGSPGLRLVPRFLEYVGPAPASINDYGSGTGRAAAELIKRGYRIHAVEIAPNAMEKEAAEFFEVKANGSTFRLGDIVAGDYIIPFSGWGYCMEVLMVIPDEQIELAVQNIRKSCLNLFAQVYDRDDVRLGHVVNTVRWPAAKWRELFARYWPEVEQIPSHEIAQRYIYVCKGG